MNGPNGWARTKITETQAMYVGQNNFCVFPCIEIHGLCDASQCARVRSSLVAASFMLPLSLLINHSLFSAQLHSCTSFGSIIFSIILGTRICSVVFLRSI